MLSRNKYSADNARVYHNPPETPRFEDVSISGRISHSPHVLTLCPRIIPTRGQALIKALQTGKYAIMSGPTSELRIVANLPSFFEDDESSQPGKP